jgi:hypothetical protein
MSKHLAIDFSEYGASFVSLYKSDVIHGHTVQFNSIQVDEIRRILNEAFEKEAFLKADFDEITVSWSSKKSTVVPNNVFAESDHSSIFQLCFGKDTASTDIDYNRISELSIVNVFEIPIWLKSYFVIKFPRVIIQHAGTHLLRKIMDANAFKLKATLVVYHDFFQITLVKHTNLEFYSFFDIESAEDIIYHLMFTLQQKEMTTEKGTIELVPGIGCGESTLSSVADGLARIKDLSGFKVNIEEHLVAKAQQLCV